MDTDKKDKAQPTEPDTGRRNPSAHALEAALARVLSAGVMLSLRRSLFDRLLNLPLPKLWDMKTGGILSRLTGDIDTTTGLLQMAIVSPAVSVIRRTAVAVTS